MAILTILSYPNQCLRGKNKEIKVFDDSLKKLASDMLETMKSAPGVGLAAPQIGKNIKLITYDATDSVNEDGSDNYGIDLKVLVNPIITKKEGLQTYCEGCLSVIELTAEVERFKNITVEGQDLNGNNLIIEASGKLAVILQHEIDHLNGTLFIDHIGKVKRDMYIKRLKKHILNNNNDK